MAYFWQYYVPYQSDIYKALEDLRAAVFRRGRYFFPPFWVMEESEQVLNSFSDNQRLLIAKARAEWLAKGKPAITPPATIEELLQATGEVGTESILDITNGISNTPRYRAISPLTVKQIMEIYGTDKPQDAERHYRNILKLRQNWEGASVIFYEGDQPIRILFCGESGT